MRLAVRVGRPVGRCLFDLISESNLVRRASYFCTRPPPRPTRSLPSCRYSAATKRARIARGALVIREELDRAINLGGRSENRLSGESLIVPSLVSQAHPTAIDRDDLHLRAHRSHRIAVRGKEVLVGLGVAEGSPGALPQWHHSRIAKLTNSRSQTIRNCEKNRCARWLPYDRPG
jgi:hypothetical protein